MEAGNPLTIFHLFSNHKWTGPAEPAVNLAVAQKKAGHRVIFAAGVSPDSGESVLRLQAAERGLDPLETIVAALKEYVQTGVLPPLSANARADG